MSKITINAESFIATGRNSFGDENGTVEVSGEVRKAVRAPTGTIFVHGYVGRYRTSGKAWNASVTLRAGQVFVMFGRDDRSSRFDKQNAISFEPETFDLHANPDFWAAI